MSGLFNPSQEHDACGVGFVARLSGVPSHQVIVDALAAMARLAHRGGHTTGDDHGDGAGVLLPLPKAFFTALWPGVKDVGESWAVGQLFLPPVESLKASVMRIIKDCLAACGLALQDGRDLPVCREIVGKSVRDAMPDMAQILIMSAPGTVPPSGDALERLLYVARRRMEKAVHAYLREKGHDPHEFYVVSLSARSIVYKGMLPGARLGELYPDLRHPSFAAPFAVFHERFSTNTLPAWRLAQPFRMLAHNGEINTLSGNVARFKSREPMLSSSALGDDLAHVLPVIDDCGSDSGKFDNVLELLVHAGYSLPHALMMMAPEPFGPTFVMGDNKRAFYEYHSALMEPWDGPTAMVFTDGRRRVGALLDRNGLRPCRYTVTREGHVVLASETGVMDVDPERLLQRGQLRPRRMLMVDVERHRLVPDAEIKGRFIREKPYRRWLKQHGVHLGDIVRSDWDSGHEEPAPPLEPERQQRLFGYTESLLRQILAPMARDGQEPIGAMGIDVPLAVLDHCPQPLFNYFKQQFAQVTNPPIDPLREDLSMSLMHYAGREKNLLDPGPEHCAILRLPHPFLDRKDMRRLRGTRQPQVLLRTLDATFPAGSGGPGLKTALDKLFADAGDALEQGATLLAISDAKAGPGRTPIPVLLAVAGLHNHLIRTRRRHLCGIIAETGEACEVMHMALLCAYGAAAICPYVAMDAVQALAHAGRIPGKLPHEALSSYVAALKKGMLKALARLGISTLRSFRGGHYFEAVGIHPEIIDAYFTGTCSRIGGVGLAELAAEAEARHAMGLATESKTDKRTTPESRPAADHLWTPDAVRQLHKAVRDDDPQAYAAYAKYSDAPASPITLRGLLRFKPDRRPVPLDEVESARDITRRFMGAAMSLGSLSSESHEALAVGCNSAGARSNCGEGGEDPARNLVGADKADRRSHVRQIASGRFGVTAAYLVHADEIQIKVAQGAKPGEGGQLPAHKVTAEIARVRGTMPGVSLVSPPPHHDIYSIEDLAQLIFDLRKLHPTASVSVKLVAEQGIGTVAVGVVKAGAHGICISGHDGGTGASPLSAIHHAGLPWEMGLSESQHALVANGLRGKTRLQVDGHLHTGRDLAVAVLLGGEEFGFGASLLVALGCVMCRQCHRGKCAVGIATQEKNLRARFGGKPEHVERFLYFLAEDLRRHMAQLGFRAVDEMVGRADLLELDPERLSSKAATLDFSGLLTPAPRVPGQNHGMPDAGAQPDTPLDAALLEHCRAALQNDGAQCVYEGEVRNTDRAVGARLAGELARRFGDVAAENTKYSIEARLNGSAGQSFGAFLTSGVTLKLKGDANDYVGKGLSGGVLIISPAAEANFDPAEQAVVGNVALYGASSGAAFLCGMAGERFAVRNSGAAAVVEGVGDHCCEYMTGGVVVVLGPCGYNFAAGMSGGVAFVYDGDERFQNRCNTDSVDLESVWTAEDQKLLRDLLERHVLHTGSPRAAALLKNWDAELPLFVKVMPLDYKEALLRQRGGDLPDSDTASATEEVYTQDNGEDE